MRVISYWNGKLPEVTELHFRSFLVHHDQRVEYCLYLEEGSTVAEAMKWLHEEPRIQIRYVKLQKELAPIGLDHLLDPPGPRGGKLLNVVVAVYRRWLKVLGNRVAFAASPQRAPIGWRTKPFGYTPRYSSLWNSPVINKEMMSDLFRILYSTTLPGNTLYVDLDVAFCVDVRSFTASRAFVYRWQHWPFGNSAIMYVPDDSPIKQGALVSLVRELGTPLPWIVFADRHCKRIDVDIVECAKFDPFWVENPFGIGDFDAFFEARPDSQARAEFVMRNCLMFHWHNNWSAVRHPGSAYDLMLRAL
jgi:hypothetical protein